MLGALGQTGQVHKEKQRAEADGTHVHTHMHTHTHMHAHLYIPFGPSMQSEDREKHLLPLVLLNLAAVTWSSWIC